MTDNATTDEKAYRRAAAACARREYCRTDWLRKFAAAGLGRLEAEEAVARLVGEGFIDEGRYARAYVHDKVAFDRWGPVKIRQALRAKGLGDDDIDQALAGVKHAETAESLRRLLQERARRLHDDDPRTRRMKLLRLAAARGYDAHLAIETVGALVRDDE